MNKNQNRDFIIKTEHLVNPRDVTTISFLGDFNRILPLKSQQRIMQMGSKNIPYMGFIVDPYCFFISYEIRDTEKAEALLPQGFELLPSSIFKDEEKKPSLIISFFSARTSAFIGTRMEMYLIARRKSDGNAAWIIIDYITDTNSYDPAHGFSGYNGNPVLFTTTPYGEIIANIKSKDNKKSLSFNADITKGKSRKLDYTLWVEGNLAVDYGGWLKDPTSKTFSLIFDPALMNNALSIPLEYLTISSNDYIHDICELTEPVSAACFPFSQHYIIEQNMNSGEITTGKDLEEKISEFVLKQNYKMMKGDDIKRPIIAGIIISAVINYSLIIFLLIKVMS